MHKTEKFKKLIEFCKQTNRTPSTSNVPEDERVLGQFYTNAKSAHKAGSLSKHEVEFLNEVNKYFSRRETKISKINSILEFCKHHNRTPIQSSKNATEKKLGQLLNTLKNQLKKGKLSESEIKALDALDPYRSNYQRSREEKLEDVLAYCKTNGRTPRQHVADETEKTLAVFLSTIKLQHRKNGLTPECIKLLNEIHEYLPESRTEKFNALLTFTKSTKRTPSINSNSPEERRMAIFFAKVKTAFKTGTLSDSEAKILTSIFSICQVKTRADKILDLVNYIESIGRIPRINSDAEDERKFAMFYNNTKQGIKNGKLTSEEIDIFNRINSIMEMTV
jgi:hypothetical protein